MSDAPMSRNGHDSVPELRQEISLLHAQVLDATAKARRITRKELVDSILSDWVEQQVTEASLIARCTRGNPDVAERFPWRSE